MPQQKVIIDTDPGVDDTLAIFFANGMPEIEFSALSSCMGNAAINTTHRNLVFIANFIFQNFGSIFKGATSPRIQTLTQAVVHGDECMGNIRPLVDLDDRSYSTSTEGITSILRNSDEKVTIIALAPLTNIASAIEADPEAFNNCERLIVLGGAFRAPGNKSPLAEFNFYVDPEAADIVLASRLCPVTLIPLDVCFQAVLQLEDLREVQNPELRDFLHHLCVPYVEGNASEEGIDGIIMYDPLAVFCAQYPDAFEYEDLYVQVHTGNESDRGWSEAQWTQSSEAPPPNVRVATKVDFKLFRDTFFNALNCIQFSPNDSFDVISDKS